MSVELVVFGILGVSGSSGHEPGSKDLQNKQGINGGVPVGSLMLKLDREIESVNVNFSIVYFYIHLCCHSFLIYEGGIIHFSWKVGDWFPKWKGRRRFICTSTVFLFG